MIEGLNDTGVKKSGLNESGWKEVEPSFDSCNSQPQDCNIEIWITQQSFSIS